MKSKKLKNTFIVMGIITFITALNFLIVYMEDASLSYIDLMPTSTQTKTENKKYKSTVYLDFNGNVNKYRLTSSIHEMANSIIVADLNARWDAGQITQAKIQNVYDTAYALDDNDPDKYGFIVIVERWKKHDFSKIVDDHNFVWNLLGGSIGKATAINEDALKETLKRLEQENK